eukprot:1850907-Rhodomonas_salina.2
MRTAGTTTLTSPAARSRCRSPSTTALSRCGGRAVRGRHPGHCLADGQGRDHLPPVGRRAGAGARREEMSEEQGARSEEKERWGGQRACGERMGGWRRREGGDGGEEEGGGDGQVRQRGDATVWCRVPVPGDLSPVEFIGCRLSGGMFGVSFEALTHRAWIGQDERKKTGVKMILALAICAMGAGYMKRIV